MGIDYQPNGDLTVKNKDVTNKPSGLWYKYVLFSTILGMIDTVEMILGCFGTHLYSYMDHIWTVWIIFGLFLDVIGMIGIIGFVKRLLGSSKKKATSKMFNVNWEHELKLCRISFKEIHMD